MPPEIYGMIAIQDGNSATISDAIANQLGLYRKLGGLVVEKDPGAPVDMKLTWLSRMFIPMEWIVNISVSLVNLSQEITQPDEEGVERLTDGSEQVKQ